MDKLKIKVNPYAEFYDIVEDEKKKVMDIMVRMSINDNIFLNFNSSLIADEPETTEDLKNLTREALKHGITLISKVDERNVHIAIPNAMLPTLPESLKRPESKVPEKGMTKEELMEIASTVTQQEVLKALSAAVYEALVGASSLELQSSADPMLKEEQLADEDGFVFAYNPENLNKEEETETKEEEKEEEIESSWDEILKENF